MFELIAVDTDGVSQRDDRRNDALDVVNSTGCIKSNLEAIAP